MRFASLKKYSNDDNYNTEDTQTILIDKLDLKGKLGKAINLQLTFVHKN